MSSPTSNLARNSKVVHSSPTYGSVNQPQNGTSATFPDESLVSQGPSLGNEDSNDDTKTGPSSLAKEDKTIVPVIGSSADSSSKQDSAETREDALSNMEEIATPKRKRGRPRKGEELRSPVKIEAMLSPRRSGRQRQKLLDQENQQNQKDQEERENSKQKGAENAKNRVKTEDEISEQKESPGIKSTGKRSRIPSSANKKKRDSTDRRSEAQIESKASSTCLLDGVSEQVSKKGPDPHTPTKAKRPVSRLSPSPSTSLSERRTKKGRPSNQENVAKQVLSIFQMDDMQLFQNRKLPNKQSPGSSVQLNDSRISINFENRGQSSFHSIPKISGIRKPESKKEEFGTTKRKEFVPFPIPEMDDEGNLKDPSFAANYLLDGILNLEGHSKLVDERAFFLEGSEGYFEQHSLRFRPSASSLASHAPDVEYEDFIPMVALGKLMHKEEREALKSTYRSLYHQWCFQLSQGYSLNLFGIGSKIELMINFLQDYLLDWYDQIVDDCDRPPAVMVINGYNPATKIKNVVHDIVSALVSDEERQATNVRMPKHVSEAFPFLMAYLKRDISQSSKNRVHRVRLVLLVHNIDGEAFRDERSQNYLSQLAALPNVWLVASTDNINSSLLWDHYKYKNFNFLWHEVTTYDSYEIEMSYKDVLSMGRSKKFVGSKGARYVLTSLTTNAKKLYKLLLDMQLEKLRQHSTSDVGRSGLRANVKLGMELREVYDKCVQAYIASNEANFKTMLGEYVEHKMCSLAKSVGGSEMVYIPFSYEEMEKLLEDEF